MHAQQLDLPRPGRILYAGRSAATAQNPTRDNGSMGHRLSKIVTRTGDAGTTGLGDGSRVAKDSARIDAIGAVDELNSTLGVLLAEALPAAVAACLVEVQHDLFDLGGELSIPGSGAVSDAQVTRLEQARRRASTPTCRRSRNSSCPAARAPRAGARGAHGVSAGGAHRWCIWARPRRVRDPARKYVNRLSDLLFVLARVLNRDAGRADVLWQKDRRRA